MTTKVGGETINERLFEAKTSTSRLKCTKLIDRNAKLRMDLSWEYEDSRYWDTVYASEEEYIDETVVTEGNDGEDEFDRKILDAIVGKAVLDVGCGTAEFTIKMTGSARQVVGVDFSREAISRALKNMVRNDGTNVRVQLADAERLPFPDGSFDVVVSRRGPVTDTLERLSEAYRVLKKDGLLMEITIGERDKQNLARIFGRGQMDSVEEKVSLSKDKMLRRVGFHMIEVKDYLATEIFGTIQDLIIRLKDSPIVPNFDVEKDRKSLEIIETKFKTEKGIATQVHRVTIIARK